jgi:beta-glucanase (GH16 family)
MIISFIKYIIVSALAICLYVTLVKPSERIYKINVIDQKREYLLVDDFNGKLNKGYWNVVERGNNPNKELQYYRKENVFFEDGNIILRANKEEYDDHSYTSAKIDTKNKFEFLYGKIILRVKPAVGKGILSAIWLLPADDSSLPEIDIIEVLGEKPDEIWSGIHYLDYSIHKKHFSMYTKKDTDFAIYELHWGKDEIRWYINDTLVHKTNHHIPSVKMYLLINLAVGGDWPGKPDDIIFPASFTIDYIIIIPEDRDIE